MYRWHLYQSAQGQCRSKKGDVDNAQNQSVGVSRGGRSTKIHAVVDGLGNPCVFMLTGGEVHDSIMMKPVLDQLDISQSVILADKAYGSAENRKYISDWGAQYCIPPKKDYQALNALFPLQGTHFVECFSEIKDYRRVLWFRANLRGVSSHGIIWRLAYLLHNN